MVLVVVRKRNRQKQSSISKKTEFPSSNFDPLSNENLLNYNTQGGGEADQVIKEYRNSFLFCLLNKIALFFLNNHIFTLFLIN